MNQQRDDFDKGIKSQVSLFSKDRKFSSSDDENVVELDSVLNLKNHENYFQKPKY